MEREKASVDMLDKISDLEMNKIKPGPAYATNWEQQRM